MSLVTTLVFIDDPNGQSSLKNADIDLHDQLTDDADWNADFWDFDAEHLQTYSKQLERMFALSAKGIEFQALWVGDKPTKTLNLSLEEFLEIVRNNRIGTKTKYVVRKNA
jgi:hypothetical protein